MPWLPDILTAPDGTLISSPQGLRIEPASVPAEAVAGDIEVVSPQMEGIGTLGIDGGVIQPLGVQPPWVPFADSAIFPESIGFGVEGGPGYRTATHVGRNTPPVRNASHQNPLHSYNATTGVRNKADLVVFMDFYRERRGGYEGFRFRDPRDYSTARVHSVEPTLTDWRDRCVIGAGDGAETEFQAMKTYGRGRYIRCRPLTHLIRPGDFGHFQAVWLNGVQQTEDVDFTIDYARGRITFTSAPGAGSQIEWAGTFHVPVWFTNELSSQDGLETNIDHSEAWSLGPMIMEEIPGGGDPDGLEFAEFRDPGGYSAQTIAGSWQVTLSDGRVQEFTASSTLLSVWLPRTTFLQPGADHLIIVAGSGSQPFTLRDHDNTVVVSSLTAGNWAELWLADSAINGTSKWLAR